MSISHHGVSLIVCAAMVAWLAGCDSATDPATKPVKPETPTKVDEHDHDHGHAHAAEGPHHGALIELGSDEYHAELVHREDPPGVTIYILDGAAKKSVAIDATEITINLMVEGKPEQVKIAASPNDGDPAGKSSRFVAEDVRLGKSLDSEKAKAQVVIPIGDKSYRGSLAHDHHDHDHDHAHDEPAKKK